MADRWVMNASPVILLAKAEVIHAVPQRGVIPLAKPALDKLRGAGAHLSDFLISRAIELAREV